MPEGTEAGGGMAGPTEPMQAATWLGSVPCLGLAARSSAREPEAAAAEMTSASAVTSAKTREDLPLPTDARTGLGLGRHDPVLIDEVEPALAGRQEDLDAA